MTSSQRAAAPLPPPPSRTPSVLDLVLPAVPPLPSALDVDPALLASPARPTQAPPAVRPPQRVDPADDEAADRRVERLRLLLFGASALVLTAVSAGALRLAL